MTMIVIYQNSSGAFRGFTCKGHAGYAEKGKPDILCSAISALTIGTINALDELAGVAMDVESDSDTGYLKCTFRQELSEKSAFLMEAMVFSLQNISREYGKKYLKIRFEEV